MPTGIYPRNRGINKRTLSIHFTHDSEFIKNNRKKKECCIFFSRCWSSKSIIKMKLTIVSVSGRFLKTKYCQNHEQDTRPEEFSQGEHLESCPKNQCLNKSQSIMRSPPVEGGFVGQSRLPLKEVIVILPVCT